MGIAVGYSYQRFLDAHFSTNAQQNSTETEKLSRRRHGRIDTVSQVRHMADIDPSKFEGTMKIAMIGTGYVGLVSGVCFSNFGHGGVCVDNSPAKIEMFNRGKMPIYEPGLDAVMERKVAASRLSCADDPDRMERVPRGGSREAGCWHERFPHGGAEKCLQFGSCRVGRLRSR